MKVTVPGWRPCKVFARSDGHRVRKQFFQRAILASFNSRCLSGASKFTLYSLRPGFSGWVCESKGKVKTGMLET